MAFIDIIGHESAEGRLKEIYDELVIKRGKLAEVHKMQSLNPETIVAHMDLYLKIMFSQSPLTRAQREMIAVVVSASNKCAYCQVHHAEALNHYWRDDERIHKLKSDFFTADLNDLDKALCEYAMHLTLYPDSVEMEHIVKKLKQNGADDRAVLDAALVISYFNFVNRMVIGLGIDIEVEGAGGYNY